MEKHTYNRVAKAIDDSELCRCMRCQYLRFTAFEKLFTMPTAPGELSQWAHVSVSTSGVTMIVHKNGTIVGESLAHAFDLLRESLRCR